MANFEYPNIRAAVESVDKRIPEVLTLQKNTKSPPPPNKKKTSTRRLLLPVAHKQKSYLSPHGFVVVHRKEIRGGEAETLATRNLNQNAGVDEKKKTSERNTLGVGWQRNDVGTVAEQSGETDEAWCTKWRDWRGMMYKVERLARHDVRSEETDEAWCTKWRDWRGMMYEVDSGKRRGKTSALERKEDWKVALADSELVIWKIDRGISQNRPDDTGLKSGTLVVVLVANERRTRRATNLPRRPRWHNQEWKTVGWFYNMYL